ncbi:MAG TPA: response regulator [Blastocatellia bacterium]
MPKKILLVDDSVTTRIMHRILIQKNGDYDVTCAHDGKEALRLAVSEKPDLILMDVMMPGIDGLEACRQLRQKPQTHDVPIVLLTFRAGDESIQRGLECGCNEYLVKPVAEAALISTLNRYLNKT